MHLQQRRLTRAFSGYVSPTVLREISREGRGGGLGGQRHHICVLFCDIRGFTEMTEQLSPEQTVELLNRYFERMTDAVHRHGGTLDKFIGDGLMAFFGAPNALPNPEASAYAAACDMLAGLDTLNRERHAAGQAPLAIGIGLHSGPAVVGHMGSSSRHEYTAVGDTVNTASRLEGLSKELGYTLICSRVVVDALGGPPRELAPLGLRGLKGHSAMEVFGGSPNRPREDTAHLEALLM